MLYLQWEEISPHIYLIWNGDGEGVVYSPLGGRLFTADGKALAIVRDYIRTGKSPSHAFHSVLEKYHFLDAITAPHVTDNAEFNPREVMISLSTLCNLNCMYCYANLGEQHQSMPWDIVARTVDQLFVYSEDDGRVGITFHGTGESVTKWNELVRTVQYALSKRTKDVGVEFTLVTNGSLIDSDKAHFLKRHGFYVSVSMDGLTDIQNRQRPKLNGSGSFDDVVRGLKALIHQEVRLAVRTTVTGHNQAEIVAFLEFCADLGCKEIITIPYSAVGRGATAVPPVDPEIFVDNYMRAFERAQELAVRLSTTTDDFRRIRARFCGADGRNFAVMPDGSVSCCSRITKREDPLASVFFIGSISEAGVRIDQGRVRSLRDLNLYSFRQCDECFARFTCAGGCPSDRLTFGELPKEHCTIVRSIIWYKLRRCAKGREPV